MSAIRASMEGELEDLLKKLSRLGSLDRKAINQSIAESLRTSTDERFDNEMSPEGAAWKRSIRAGNSGKTLTKTGRLRGSIHARASASGAAVGTNTVYAATHQFGTGSRTIRARNKPFLRFQVNGSWVRAKQVTIKIPARPFLGISSEDEDEIRTIIEEALEEI